MFQRRLVDLVPKKEHELLELQNTANREPGVFLWIQLGTIDHRDLVQFVESNSQMPVASPKKGMEHDLDHATLWAVAVLVSKQPKLHSCVVFVQQQVHVEEEHFVRPHLLAMGIVRELEPGAHSGGFVAYDLLWSE
ncbi:hypothetical protein OGAPHI_006367 [Ogataea philodendri]|uniref:Uncharacterized protein n=1 Tax=Ogataea philodendri TaxID=1378263 RepID=A0A9P8T0U1_9ASCO|nr:uncharacterized protein OGAPHI_006367 [Ogataea philodendri]KAH3661519.1 hypothetical protein OGAPHI_006367 [Ogataea philodendri]